eukprot:scaffold11173_cov84-Cylindrotheca_fusiformis.AAC.1
MVADSFVTVTKVCGVEERGIALRKKWLGDLERLRTTILEHRTTEPTPKMFLLEWLDPPFDSGHWTYQMVDFACAEMANKAKRQTGVKSRVIEWNDVYEAKPDVVVVGCCGFDLERNVHDIKVYSDNFAPLAKSSTKIFACDGNEFIAQPGPSLLQGVAVLAQCAYHDQPEVIKAIDALNIIPASQGFQLVDLQSISLPEKKEGKPIHSQQSL